MRLKDPTATATRTCQKNCASHFFVHFLACENIRFSVLFASSQLRRFVRNVPSGEERGETDLFAGYSFLCPFCTTTT